MSDFHSFRASAVVLRHADYGEADRLLTLFTREQGKVRAIARGVRKVTSRKAGHIEPFTYVTLQLARGRGLLIVTQAETVNSFPGLREDLVKTSYAAYIIELLDRFTYEEETPHPPVFRLLTETLERIEKESDAWLPIRYYEIRLLDFLGFRPQLFECVNCGCEIQPEDQYFSFSAGVAICPRCGQGLPNPASISMAALKYLRHFQRSSYAVAVRARATMQEQKEVETLMQGYLTYLLEHELNTPAFIKRIKS
jgi:DNA repair protein RecO (recombination protein O)